MTVKLRLFCLMTVVAGATVVPTITTAQVDSVLVKQYVGRAIDYMDRNLIDDAIKQWDLALIQRPDYVPYRYERALCHVMAKRYEQAIDSLLLIYQDPALFDRGYQLLGNCYDYRGDSTKALTIYHEGLKAFPRSGRLYYEIGSSAFIAGETDKALALWVRGTRVEPRFATNYYWICKGLARTPNKIWSVLYGELFLNLEPSSDRSKEISELLYFTWNAALRLGSEDPIRLCSEELLNQPSKQGADQMNFATAFEYTTALAAQKFIPDTGVVERLTILQLAEVRETFLKAWQAAGYLDTYQNDVLSWQARIMREGYLKEYLVWIVSNGDRAQMQNYLSMSSDRFDLFFAWLASVGGLNFDAPKCVWIGCEES
jgi:tetratricopeptide (TPR) repeat protein